MSIVQTVLHRHKLRQERHSLEHLNYRTRRSLPTKHAAPAGAWMALGVSRLLLCEGRNRVRLDSI
jgi:hypothetical protein